MPRKFYSIYFVPHARARFREVRFTRSFVGFAAALAVLMGLSALLLPGLTLSSWSRGRALERLEKENAGLLQANEAYEQDVAELRSQVAEFETMAMKFALMAGVEDLPLDGSPVGSPGDAGEHFPAAGPEADYLDEELTILRGRALALEDSFEALEQAYAEQEMRLATTPSILPTRGILGSGYRNRKDPFSGEREFHAGLDIVANAGTPVVATADGVVTRAGRRGGYGKVVFVSHGNELSTRYAHLSSISVKPGQKVRRGDVLGKVGATGRAMGYHLHYEVLRGDRKVNPIEYILDDGRLN
jgi:murein DD-endopeptidase MepM/ murein hydrolase activator NlpD